MFQKYNLHLYILLILISLNTANCASPMANWEDFSSASDIRKELKKGDKVILRLKNEQTLEGTFVDLDSTAFYLESENESEQISKINIRDIRTIRKQTHKKLPPVVRLSVGVVFLSIFLFLLAWSELGPAIGDAL